MNPFPIRRCDPATCPYLEKYSDFTIKAGDKEFKVHKSMLAIHSPVFDAMFRNEGDLGEANSMTIEEFSSSVVKDFIEYIYTGSLKHNANTLKLYKLAKKFGMEELQKFSAQKDFDAVLEKLRKQRTRALATWLVRRLPVAKPKVFHVSAMRFALLAFKASISALAVLTAVVVIGKKFKHLAENNDLFCSF